MTGTLTHKYSTYALQPVVISLLAVSFRSLRSLFRIKRSSNLSILGYDRNLVVVAANGQKEGLKSLAMISPGSSVVSVAKDGKKAFSNIRIPPNPARHKA